MFNSRVLFCSSSRVNDRSPLSAPLMKLIPLHVCLHGSFTPHHPRQLSSTSASFNRHHSSHEPLPASHKAQEHSRPHSFPTARGKKHQQEERRAVVSVDEWRPFAASTFGRAESNRASLICFSIASFTASSWFEAGRWWTCSGVSSCLYFQTAAVFYCLAFSCFRSHV